MQCNAILYIQIGLDGWEQRLGGPDAKYWQVGALTLIPKMWFAKELKHLKNVFILFLGNPQLTKWIPTDTLITNPILNPQLQWDEAKALLLEMNPGVYEQRCPKIIKYSTYFSKLKSYRDKYLYAFDIFLLILTGNVGMFDFFSFD